MTEDNNTIAIVCGIFMGIFGIMYIAGQIILSEIYKDPKEDPNKVLATNILFPLSMVGLILLALISLYFNHVKISIMTVMILVPVYMQVLNTKEKPA